MLDQIARHWWTLTLRGALAVIFGLIALAHPVGTVGFLVILLGAYFLVDGILALVASFRFSHQDGRWTLLLIEGIFGILAGIVTLAHPVATAVALIYLVAIWAIITGILEVVTAVQLRRVLTGEFLLALTGVVSIVLGIALLTQPSAGLIFVAYLIGAYALLFGILLIALSLRLRNLPGNGARLYGPGSGPV